MVSDFPNPVSDKSSRENKDSKGERPQSPKKRVIRVFISSTFRDMHEERDELVKRVFPQLRKLCEKRGVVWGEVDLRWGITEEQRAEGKVLPICFAEKSDCLPYVIGILGERYGWIPNEIPEELIKQEPWLTEYQGRSITELEIIQRVLNDPKMADNAFFYFRDPAYVDSLPKIIQTELRERPIPDDIKQFGLEEARRRSKDRLKKLQALKARIRTSGLPLRENYRNPQDLGKLVLKDLTDVINRLFPRDMELDPLDSEAYEHETLACNKERVYIGREEYFRRLDEHVRDDGPPLVVLGESGSGKSALLANWAMKYRREHPDEILIMHFIGATPQSADWLAMLRRIMGEFKRSYDIQQDIPTEPDKLRKAFTNWLHMVSAKGRIVLILDALNQIEDKDNALDLVWLPPVIPENIRLILSTLPGRPLVDLKKRRWSMMEVQPLSIVERKKLIGEYLAQYRKTLSNEWVDSIASAGLTHNPLYLRSLLEELRVFGEYERLDDSIAHYLVTESVPELFEKILERYEMDYNQERPHLVRDAMTIIWAARQGVSEAELLDILGENNESLPHAFWAPFCLAASRFFISRSGLICFSHAYIRQAIENQYLPTEEKKQAAHLSLADYFSTKEIVQRVINELPWQLARAKSWQRLYDLLTNLEFFEKSWEKNKYDVMSHWATIGRSSSLSLKNAYRNVVDNPVGVYNDKTVLYVSDLLTHMGHPEEALSLLRFLTEYYRQTDALKSLGECLSKQAAILWRHGDLDGAMVVLNEQEAICRELGDPHGLESALRYQAVVLQKHGDLDKAMELNKEAEQICLQYGITEGLQWSLGNQGYLLLDKGEMDSAMTLFEEQERICREIGDRSSLQICLGNQAGVFMRHGEMENAMPLLKEQEHISREFGDLIGIHVSLGNQAAILSKWGKLNDAMVLSKEKERICRELKDTVSLQVSLINQAWILKELGDLDGAMTLFKETESNCRELKLPDTLASSIVNQAQILEKKGNMKEALNLAEKAYQLASEHSLIHLAEKVVKPVMDRIRLKIE